MSGLDKHLRVFGIYVVFKAIGKIMKEMRTDRKEKLARGLSLPAFQSGTGEGNPLQMRKSKLGDSSNLLPSEWPRWGLTLKSVLLTP